MTETLIAYHSRTGCTRRVAQIRAYRLDADLEEIRVVSHSTVPLAMSWARLRRYRPRAGAQAGTLNAGALVLTGFAVASGRLFDPRAIDAAAAAGDRA